MYTDTTAGLSIPAAAHASAVSDHGNRRGVTSNAASANLPSTPTFLVARSPPVDASAVVDATWRSAGDTAVTSASSVNIRICRPNAEMTAQTELPEAAATRSRSTHADALCSLSHLKSVVESDIDASAEEARIANELSSCSGVVCLPAIQEMHA